MKIAVDVYGGDNAPVEIVKGCIESINEMQDFSLVLVGKSEPIENELKNYTYDKSRIEVVAAEDVITNEDVPTDAIRIKKDSSLVRALELTKSDENIKGLISAGSTGAVLTGAVLKIGRQKGITRPALAPILPTGDGKEVCLIDCGANVDCKAEYLAQFALMGSSYMKAVYGLENPRVALVSNGVEDKKGNELTHEAFKLLKQLPINFVGNMEARDAFSGKYDVLVCDGFVGNVLLKTIEGTATTVFKLIKNSILSSKSAKFGYLFMKKAFKNVREFASIDNKGGAPFLGAKKLIVKAHGSSDAKAFKSAIFQIVKMAQGNLVENIASELEKVQNILANDSKPEND